MKKRSLPVPGQSLTLDIQNGTPVSKEVLDIGAGAYPAPGTTRAVDIRVLPPKKINRPKTLVEYKQADARRKIPYDSGFFDKVISRWAIGSRIGGFRVYQEIARVLKPGGEVEIRVRKDDERSIPKVLDRLEEVKIKVIGVDEHIFEHVVEYAIHGIYTP